MFSYTGISSRILSRGNRLRTVLTIAIFLGFSYSSFAKDTTRPELANPSLIDAFYKIKENRLFWFSGNDKGMMMRQQLLSLLTNCDTQGLNPEDYSVEMLKDAAVENEASPTAIMTADRLYTGMALAYFKDLLCGNFPSGSISYDELSQKALQQDNSSLIHLLVACSDAAMLAKMSADLEPVSDQYALLKAALHEALQEGKSSNDTLQQLKVALNIYRWIHHFHYAKCIVVNIPSAQLYYYERDSLMLDMKVVLGKPSTPTPRFAAHGNQIILYPYWNVPHSIAVNEFLPLCKRSRAVLDVMNMQVLNSKGEVLDHNNINWAAYSKKNFPFRFRQSTGCDNALGVIKLNLTSPYSVYLHDTNAKYAFKSNKRFLSHGCIRIEKPIELCKYLWSGFDKTLVEACVKNQKPVVKTLPEPVPVFVIYSTADIEGHSVKYYPDIYRLNRNL